jgi:acyl-CoA dehydrogenase
VVLALIVLSVVAFGVLAMRRAPLWQWAVVALVIGLLTRFGFDAAGLGMHSDLLGWMLALLPAAILGLFAIRPVRLALLSAPAHRLVKSILPRVSRTEQEALDAGTVGWDAELFSGRPRWEQLLNIRKPTLTAEEQAFLDGPVNKLCSMLDDWDIRHNRADLPPEVWAYLKDNGFFGMLISKEHGGLGFSAQAQSIRSGRASCSRSTARPSRRKSTSIASQRGRRSHALR